MRGRFSEDDVDPVVFLARRANAFRASATNTCRCGCDPSRLALRPGSIAALTVGDLVQFSALDPPHFVVMNGQSEATPA